MNCCFERRKIKKPAGIPKNTRRNSRLDIQLFHSDLPAGQNEVDVFDERRVELLDRRNRGAVFLSNSGEGIAASHGVVDRSSFLLFHQSIDLCLHGRVIIPGSSALLLRTWLPTSVHTILST